MRFFLACALAVLLGACVQKGSPVGAIDAYADAVESGNYARAYALMSEDFRARVSRDTFMKMMRESPANLRAGARRLKSGAHAVDVRATYVYDDSGEELRLVQEDGEWRLDMNPLDFYPQDTPRGALRSFIRAVEYKRYDILVRLVPKRYAMSDAQIKEQFEGPMAKEVMGLVGRLREALEAPVQELGDSAAILYGDRQEIKLVREDGAWKIDDFD